MNKNLTPHTPLFLPWYPLPDVMAVYKQQQQQDTMSSKESTGITDGYVVPTISHPLHCLSLKIHLKLLIFIEGTTLVAVFQLHNLGAIPDSSLSLTLYIRLQSLIDPASRTSVTSLSFSPLTLPPPPFSGLLSPLS